jgi:hypothetical protein
MSGPTPSKFFRLQGELAREKRLTEASYALHTTLDLGEILQLILGAACDGVQADRGTVFVLSADGREIWSRVVGGDEHLEIRLPLGQGIAGTVAQTGETIRIGDAYADRRFDPNWDRRTGYRTRQILCKPIRSREGRIVGVFQLLNKKEGSFEDADEAYLDALSVHAALALENAQLHASALERERQAREILLVQEVQRAYQPERATLEVEGLRVAGLNILCEDASGDYYDFIPLEDGRHVVVIGDVSGHGLKSALVMAQARAFLRAFSSTVEPLTAVLDRLGDRPFERPRRVVQRGAPAGAPEARRRIAARAGSDGAHPRHPARSLASRRRGGRVGLGRHAAALHGRRDGGLRSRGRHVRRGAAACVLRRAGARRSGRPPRGPARSPARLDRPGRPQGRPHVGERVAAVDVLSGPWRAPPTSTRAP